MINNSERDYGFVVYNKNWIIADLYDDCAITIQNKTDKRGIFSKKTKKKQ